MKWSSNSGSLLSLSQWLHTHSCSVPSPCCPLSAGLGSPSLRKSCGRESPMRKCLKSWTEGKSILSIEISRGRGGWGAGGVGGGGVMGWRATRRCIQGSWDVIYGLSFSSSPPPPPQSQPAKWWLPSRRSWCQREPSSPALCVCLSVGDCIRRCSSITDRAVVCTVELVWEQEGGELGGGSEPAGEVQRRRREWR